MIVNAAKCYFADHPPVKIILIFFTYFGWWLIWPCAKKESRLPRLSGFFICCRSR
jgi:hypothetical protein